MFITNNDTGSPKFGERLKDLMSISNQLDILVGFFYFSGVSVLVDPLKEKKDMRLRILVGMEADQIMGRIVEYDSGGGANDDESIRRHFYDSLEKTVGSAAVDKQAFQERLPVFLELLQENRLEIRKTRDPNHAKLYIFSMDDAHKVPREHVWLTGSSNLSEPGLSLQNELNVEICDFGAEHATEYFDGLWEDAVPLTDDEEQRRTLVRILQERSVAAPLTPYEAYFLLLKTYLNYQKANLNTARLDRILSYSGFTKYRYQVDAVAQAMTKLDAYHGVIIADVVGLGKSIIAGLIAAMREKRGIIVCPPGLMGNKDGSTGGWYEYVNRFKLHDWVVWSRGDMEGLQTKLRNDPDFQMVIVDEAHNFRNEKTRDFGLLAEACYGREVVLLTATPFNNRPSDLLALLHLFSPGKNSPFVPGGNLDELFKSFGRDYKHSGELQKAIAVQDWKRIQAALHACGIADQEADGASDMEKVRKASQRFRNSLMKQIRQVMEKIVIRRNRIDLTSDPDYQSEITTLSHVHAPVQEFFELTHKQDVFYDCVINEYFGPEGRFHGAVYRPQEYLRDQSGQDDYQNNIYLMMRRLLVMRFESSFGAFRESLKRARDMMKNALHFTEREGCFLYSRKAMERVMQIEDEMEAEEEFQKVLEELQDAYKKSGRRGRNDRIAYWINGADFEGRRFVSDIKSDIVLFDEVIQEVDGLGLSENDPKCEKFIRTVRAILSGTHSEIVSEGEKRKVLLFTGYSDTMRHLKPIVEKAFPGRVLAIDGENFTKARATELKANFDASFETHEDKYDILLATDKLSEGFNLNRAGVVINYDIPWNPTRVIQRVGRINRIGKKVFDNLYILNFFPTVKGAAINQNRQIAQDKMFAIHEILGEDAQIFSVDEEPSAAALFQKLSAGLDDNEVISFYTRMKKEYNTMKNFLEKNHPEVLDRIGKLPQMVKTAWEGNPHGIYMFRRQGPGFFAIVHNRNDGKISEWTLEEALPSIRCMNFHEKRCSFSEDFWTHREVKKTIEGIYDRMKNFKPELKNAGSGISDNSKAVNNLQNLKSSLSSALMGFASDVIEDIRNFGTIPVYVIAEIARNPLQSEEDRNALTALLERLRDRRGEHYLNVHKIRTTENDIVVTIEKR